MTLISVGKHRPWLDEALARHPTVAVGRYTYKPGSVRILLYDEDAEVSIGNFCSLGNGLTVYGGGNHHVEWATTFLLRATWRLPGELDAHTRTSTVVGNDVWLGNEVTVLSGAEIGDGCVIGANSTVRGRLPPYTVALGNPAKVIRARFRPETIERLEALEWWAWPLERILFNADRLCSNPDDWPADLVFPEAPASYVAPPRAPIFDGGWNTVQARVRSRLIGARSLARGGSRYLNVLRSRS